MAAADEAERHGAVESAGARQSRHWTATSIGQCRMRHAFLGGSASSDQSILGLEKDAYALGHIVRHERRNADAEIDQHSRSEFPGNTAGDDDLRFHHGLMHA